MTQVFFVKRPSVFTFLCKIEKFSYKQKYGQKESDVVVR